MKLDYAGKHVVVTGATGNLGQEVVSLLVDLGAECHVPARSAEALGGFQMARNSRVHVTMDVDLSEESSVVGFFDGVPELWASIHCAGAFARGAFEDTDAAAFDAQLRANLWTCFLCCREAVKKIKATATDGGRGRIVNVSARPALEPRLGAGMVAYTAAKAGVNALSQALAEEYATAGIWVNAVVPSIIGTEDNLAAMPEARHDRWAKVDEVASTIIYLASPMNTSTRGGLVPVYGRS